MMARGWLMMGNSPLAQGGGGLLGARQLRSPSQGYKFGERAAERKPDHKAPLFSADGTDLAIID
jgi:hypothetical protein